MELGVAWPEPLYLRRKLQGLRRQLSAESPSECALLAPYPFPRTHVFPLPSRACGCSQQPTLRQILLRVQGIHRATYPLGTLDLVEESNGSTPGGYIYLAGVRVFPQALFFAVRPSVCPGNRPFPLRVVDKRFMAVTETRAQATTPPRQPLSLRCQAVLLALSDVRRTLPLYGGH